MSTRKVAQVKLASVERADGPVQFPKDWSWQDLAQFALDSEKRENQPVVIRETIKAFPLDGALALFKALERTFGIALVRGDKREDGSESDVPLVAIERGPEDKVMVPWGSFKLPAGAGVIGIQAGTVDGLPVLKVAAQTLHKYEGAVRGVIDLAKRIVKEESVYKGRALRLFYSESFFSGEFADVRFMDLRGVDASDLVFSRDLERAININVFAPLRYGVACRAIGIPGKRGVLLAGRYGTGKTLLALVTAQVANASGVTFVYVQDISRLPDAFIFAQQYAPSIVFVEDIDRVANERDDELNEILNTLDGIESKNKDVMVVMTTNHVERIHPALRDRPGRVDVILEIGPPDAEAAERLLRKYARDLLAESESLVRVAGELAGQIPAVIREVVERAKLAMVARTAGALGPLVAADLEAATDTVLKQREIAAREHTPQPNAFDLLGQVVGERIGAGLVEAVQSYGNGRVHESRVSQ